MATEELIRPGDPEYDSARCVWNRAVDRHPAGIARCHSTGDVLAGLDLARSRGLEVAVRGGGHSFPGFSTTEGGLVLDLGPMRQIAIDPQRCVARIGPGVRWAELTEAAATHGLVPVGGHVADVGVAGLTLGGGNGWLCRVFGLACDNLVSAQVVTADGTLVIVSADQHPELHWALRGGGGNFGIVTEFTLRLHPLGPLLGGMVMYRMEQAAEVLRSLAEFGAAAPAEVNAAPAVLSAPDAPFVPADLRGHPVLAIAACYVRTAADGERALAPLRRFGTPVANLLAPTTFRDLQHFFDAQGVSTPYHMRSHLGGPITEDLISAVLDFGTRLSSPSNVILLLPLGGVVAEVAPDATAFWHRDAAYCLEIGAAWRTDDPAPEVHRAWADELWTATRSWATGVEVNHLADEGVHRVHEAYGDNWDRLVEVKRSWDPDNLFHLNQNIPPGGD